MNMTTTPPAPAIETPLQQALAGADGPAVHAAHRARLAALAEACRAQLAAGVAPAEFSATQELLAMCEAGTRVLESMPRAAETAGGPATLMPRPAASGL